MHTSSTFHEFPRMNSETEVTEVATSNVRNAVSETFHHLRSNNLVAVVDPFSTGAVIASLLFEKGVHVVAVYSANMDQLERVQNLVPQGLALEFQDVIRYSDVESMLSSINQVASRTNSQLVAIIAGAETGVELADELSERLNLRTNGTSSTGARRNKFIMGETVRAAGLRAVKQLKSCAWSEVEGWISDWQPNPFRVIVKPIDSAGSDDVTLCRSLEEVQSAFGSILGKVNGLGFINEAVLVQEYLDGDEYVVDCISRDGEHKVVAIWVYDRRPVNGAQFVCYGQRLLTMDDPCTAELVEYQKCVLNALGIVNGPSHGEVKWCGGEPVLVEVGSRCHGAEGSWILPAQGVYGYNQAAVTANFYLDPSSFDSIPSMPIQRFGYGRLMFIIVKKSGTLIELNFDLTSEISNMESVCGFEFFLKPGAPVVPTVDCFTFGGLVKLFHSDLRVVMRDWDRVREIEDLDLFITE